jgi:hypothetical protein
MKRLSLMTAILALVAALPAPVHAGIVIGTESDSDGFTGDLFGPRADSGYNVASDGEATFHAFGADFDTSDGIQFPTFTSWAQVGDAYTSLGDNTWVLRANGENGNPTEAVGVFTSPDPWVQSAIGVYIINESDGSSSDYIILFNNANGANVIFVSEIPEPGSLTLLGLAAATMGGIAWLKKRKSRAVAA